MSRVITIIAVVVSLYLAGCAPSKSTFVLIADSEGKIGQIDVITETGTKTLSQNGDSLVVKDIKTNPGQVETMSAGKIDSLFGDAMEAQPPVPDKFIIYFLFDSTRLHPESEQIMSKILHSIQKRNSNDISVTGHTDRAGASMYNYQLSLRRANYIRDRLIKVGVAPDYISATSHGEGNLLVQTADNKPESRNRRVEVTVR